MRVSRSDTGGSVRIPASVRGVFGLKPTYGPLPRTGSMKLAPSIVVLGPVARSVRNLALILGIEAGSDGDDAQRSMRSVPDYLHSLGRGVEGLRIGTPRNHFFERFDPQIRSAREHPLSIFEAAGARIVEIDIPFAAHLAELSRTVVYSEATAIHADSAHSCAASRRDGCRCGSAPLGGARRARAMHSTVQLSRAAGAQCAGGTRRSRLAGRSSAHWSAV
ncbi:MAG: hypothetical protein FJ178_02890 [Gammaproteobacteria bacterium]|nr:hypothetical protein [Gammaproteobacteria bacterium]